MKVKAGDRTRFERSDQAENIRGKPLFTQRDLVYLLYLFLFRILAALLPVRMIRLIGVPLGYVYKLMNVQKAATLQKRLSLAYGTRKTPAGLRRISNLFLSNAVNRFIDDLILNRLSKEELLRSSHVKGLQNLKTALSAKKGVFLVSGHFSCNRVGKRLLREIGFPVMSVRSKFARNPKTSLVGAKYLKPRHSEFLKSVIDDEVFIQDPDLSLKILRRVRDNGLVNIHIDGAFSHQTVKLSFLGGKRSFPAGFLRIAHLTGAAIVPMLCVGNSKCFTIMFEKPFKIQKKLDEEKFISSNLEQLVGLLESQILQYPDQWGGWLRTRECGM
jgi:KDO2-lipid IV(A) lauroyltransferase